MFTGIVTAVGNVMSVEGRDERTLRMEAPWDCNAIPIGASVAHAGVCLSVTRTSQDGYEVEASAQTLAMTTIGEWREGCRVNLERSLRVGDELGGHFVFGHVDGIASVVGIEESGESHVVRLHAPEGLSRYLAPRGSVSLDGVSLTVNEVDGAEFAVNVIAHTWQVTTFADLREGNSMNMEVDMLARYVERLSGGRG